MIGLETLKYHCRVDGDDFDQELIDLRQAAVDHFRSIDVDMDVYPLPEALSQAVMLLVKHWFDEANGGFVASDLRQSPLGIRALVEPFRKASL